MSSNPNDKVYTPYHIVKDVLDWCLPFTKSDASILEPFMGQGAFFDQLSERHSGKLDACEIDIGLDFFEYSKKCDWIITNPPYSTFSQSLSKCMEVSQNVVLLIPINKLVSSMPRLIDVKNAGFGIREVYYLGSGRQVGFPFGFPVAAVWLQQGYDLGYYKEKYHDRCYLSKTRVRRG